MPRTLFIRNSFIRKHRNDWLKVKKVLWKVYQQFTLKSIEVLRRILLIKALISTESFC